MWELPNLADIIRDHLLSCSRRTQTYFSSWAADLRVAERYGKPTSDGHIAIVDTTLCSDPISIYYTPDMKSSRIFNVAFGHEYLAFGPISGPAYHCVKFSDIAADLSRLRKRVYDRRSIRNPKPDDVWDDLKIARRVAERFRRPDDSRPDVVIFVMVTLLSYSANSSESRSMIVDQLCMNLRNELKSYMRRPGSRPAGLVNPGTPTKSQPTVRETLELMAAMEQRIKDKGIPRAT